MHSQSLPETTASHNEQNYKPKAIIFDLLTGLLDSWSLWEFSLSSSASSSSSPSSSPSSSLSASSPTGRQWRERYLAITFTQGRYTPYETLVHQAAKEVGVPASAAQTLLKDWHLLKPWPEVPATLARLRQQDATTADIKLAVLTNCSDILGREAVRNLCETVKEESGGGDFAFDVVVTAEESGWYKPRKEAYEAGLKALGLGAEDVLFVAGSAGDVEGATSVGMRVVWNNHVGLSRRGEGVEPWKEGKGLDEVLSVVLPH